MNRERAFSPQIIDHVILIKLYNFEEKEQALKSIGQKLKAIFSLQVGCFTGCKQNADYTLLCKQYKVFDLPPSTQIKQGLTKWGKDRTTLQALCKDQGWYLRKPQHVRVGTCFASTKGSLSEEVLTYLQKYKRSRPSSGGFQRSDLLQ